MAASTIPTAPAEQGRDTRKGAQETQRDAGVTAHQKALPMPHERDESLGQADTAVRDEIRQAKADLDQGQVDTDLHSTPGLDAQRRAKLVPGAERKK